MISLLVIFTFGLVLAGCSSSAGDRTNMYGALVYDNPDSLLQVVMSVDTAGMNDFDLNEYRLMYTAAMWRTGSCIGDTSDISACEHYFSCHGDKELTALSKLYHAENAYHNFEYYKSVRKIMEALNLLQHSDNNALKYNLLNLLYRINTETECYDRASSACRRALECAEKGGYANQVADARNNMAAMLAEQGLTDEAAVILDSNYKITDKRILSEYYRIRGLLLLRQDSTDAAHEMLLKSENTMPTAETFYDMALLYLKKGSVDSCLNYCHFAITADRRGYVSSRAYNIIVENFSNRLGMNTLKRICSDLNNLYLKRAESADALKIDAMQGAYEEDNDGVSVMALLFVVLVFSVVAVIYFRKRNIRADGDVMLINENIVYDLRKLCSRGATPSQEQWITLHNAANRHIPFFLTHLHKINDLFARDINICLLTRMHFSPSEIAVLVGVSPQSVTNTRSRLLTKIFGVKGGAAEFDRRINQIRG